MLLRDGIQKINTRGVDSMKFSKRHNLYNDQAITRYKLRELVGGVIVCCLVWYMVIAIMLMIAR